MRTPSPRPEMPEKQAVGCRNPVGAGKKVVDNSQKVALRPFLGLQLCAGGYLWSQGSRILVQEEAHGGSCF